MKKEDKKASANSLKMNYDTFDLQAVLTLPYTGDCQIYCETKLSLFNFTVIDSSEQGHCFYGIKPTERRTVQKSEQVDYCMT